MKKLLLLVLVLSLILPIGFAEDVELTEGQEAGMAKIKTSILQIYEMVKWVATAIGALMLAFVGMKFMTSGNDPHARNEAKTMATYIVIGLIVIWLAGPVAETLVF
ncbi:unnamed protein product [marine sediment metagenome]|uniref:TrbC/VIRB2 family protein n=1 Tax=marine sediment metagenome TaxID=412755 RepID=X1UFD3_9ZZZZ